MTTTIERIRKTVESFRDGSHDTIKPGMPFEIPSSWCAGDCGAQGDLIFVVIDEISEGYQKIENPTEQDKQLVPGNTVGSRHCLDSLDGVELYRREDWGPESLDGPELRVTKDRVVNHPTHGPWTIPAGRTIRFEYPRVFDSEQKRERRNLD